MPFEKIEKKIVVRKEHETDSSLGCRPEERKTDEIINYGIINVDKPKGPTSHQVYDYVQKILNINKSGHSGTLDPAVTGVLPVALGRGTRIVQALLKAGKEYVGIMYLHKTVEEIARKIGLPKPKLYIVPTPAYNAFATGPSPKKAVVACTEGILSLLTDVELEGVLAHEMSHIKNRDMLVTTIAATMAAVISYLAMMARFAAIFGGMRDRDGGGNLIGLLAMAILAPLIAIILQLAISRSREYLADSTGAKIIGNPKALANALEKLHQGVKAKPMKGNSVTSSLFIVNPFSAAGIAGLFSTHPPMKERVKRLREMKI